MMLLIAGVAVVALILAIKIGKAVYIRARQPGTFPINSEQPAAPQHIASSGDFGPFPPGSWSVSRSKTNGKLSCNRRDSRLRSQLQAVILSEDQEKYDNKDNDAH